MNIMHATATRRPADCRRLALQAVALLVATGLCGASPVRAAGGSSIIQVEEDWELVVQVPDSTTQSPQVTCTISPVGDVGSVYAVFDVNLKNLPDYDAGGMQLQIWNGAAPVSARKSNVGTLLQNVGETVHWTQRMSLNGGQLSFQVVNGTSQTWGNFGNGGTLAVSLASDLDDLAGYSPDVTVANSGIGYAGNRVGSLTLKAVRLYSAAGLVSQDNQDRVIYQHE